MLPLKFTCTSHQALIALCCQMPLVAPIASGGFSTCWIQICNQMCALTTPGIQAALKLAHKARYHLKRKLPYGLGVVLCILILHNLDYYTLVSWWMCKYFLVIRNLTQVTGKVRTNKRYSKTALHPWATTSPSTRVTIVSILKQVVGWWCTNLANHPNMLSMCEMLLLSPSKKTKKIK